MRDLIDEILEIENFTIKNHPCGCSCRNCQSKSNKKYRSSDKEFFDGLSNSFDDLMSALKRKFNCSIEDLTSKSRPVAEAINSGKTPRDLSKIDAVVLHQMAFSRGSDLNKYLSVKAHFIVMPDGKVGQLYPFSTYLNSSNTLNSRSVAVEFAGNFPSTNNKCYMPEKFGCHQLTQQQIDGGRCLMSFLKEKLPQMKFVFAHRQSSSSRANDPGPDIWANVGEWAMKNLGYAPSGISHSENGGQTIPANWRTPR